MLHSFGYSAHAGGYNWLAHCHRLEQGNPQRLSFRWEHKHIQRLKHRPNIRHETEKPHPLRRSQRGSHLLKTLPGFPFSAEQETSAGDPFEYRRGRLKKKALPLSGRKVAHNSNDEGVNRDAELPSQVRSAVWAKMVAVNGAVNDLYLVRRNASLN
jgi:hypothetical protein